MVRTVLRSLAVGLLAAPLAAQDPVPTPRDTVRAEIGVARMDLRSLVVAQEAFFADHGRYSGSLDSLNFRPTQGSRLVLSVVRPDGWAATLTRARLRGTCVMFVNLPEAVQPKTALDGALPEEGAPLCDSQPELNRATIVPTPASGDSTRQQINTARADLRNLVTAQEAYFADHARYALRLEELNHTRYRASEGTVLRLVNASTLGWGGSSRIPGCRAAARCG